LSRIRQLSPRPSALPRTGLSSQLTAGAAWRGARLATGPPLPRPYSPPCSSHAQFGRERGTGGSPGRKQHLKHQHRSATEREKASHRLHHLGCSGSRVLQRLRPARLQLESHPRGGGWGAARATGRRGDATHAGRP
jgi:hypothetical protein